MSKQLDELFSGGLEEIEVTPSARANEKFGSLIKQKKGGVIWWRAIAATILLLLSFGVYLMWSTGSVNDRELSRAEQSESPSRDQYALPKTPQQSINDMAINEEDTSTPDQTPAKAEALRSSAIVILTMMKPKTPGFDIPEAPDFEMQPQTIELADVTETSTELKLPAITIEYRSGGKTTTIVASNAPDSVNEEKTKLKRFMDENVNLDNVPMIASLKDATSALFRKKSD